MSKKSVLIFDKDMKEQMHIVDDKRRRHGKQGHVGGICCLSYFSCPILVLVFIHKQKTVMIRG